MKKQYFLSIVLILIGGLLGNVLRFTERKPDRIADFSAIPDSYQGYIGTEEKLEDFAYNILRADVITLKNFTTPDGKPVHLYAAYFASQKYGSQIHSPRHCLPGGGWRIDYIQPFRLDLPEGLSREVNRLLISTDGHKAVMLYWYETRGGSIRNEYGLKLDLVKNSLLFRPTDAAIIRVTVDAVDGNIDAATGRAVRFLQVYSPFIRKSLPF